MPKDALRHILKDGIVYASDVLGGKTILKEPANIGIANTLEEVIIEAIPKDSLILSADSMPSTLFRQEKHPDCTCHNFNKYKHVSDYIIITSVNNEKFIIYIEMKTSPRGKEHIPQLWCARGQIEYLSFMMENLENIERLAEYKHRYVKFCKIAIDKTLTDISELTTIDVQKVPELNDKPSRAFKYFVSDGVPVNIKDLIYEFNH
jgi:hypothetical protein